MIKIFPLALLVAISTVQAQAPVALKFEIRLNTSKAGTAEMTTTELADKQRQVLMTMDLSGPAGNGRVRLETIYDVQGAASRKVMEVVVSKTKRTLTTAELSDKGAKLTIREGKDVTTKDIPLESSAPRKNPSTYWFDRILPKVGEKSVYYSFDLTEQAWRLESVTYVGPGTKTIKGKPVKYHILKIERGSVGAVFVDETGQPLKMDFGGLVINREGFSELQAPK